MLPHVGRVFEIGRQSGKPVYREQVTFYPRRRRAHLQRADHDRGGRRRRGGEILRRHGRRHHRSGPGAALLGLGRRGAPHRPRDQEPADADPALGRAHPAPLRQGDHRGPRGFRPVHRHHHPAGRGHRPHGRRILGLRAHAEAGDEGHRSARIAARGLVPGRSQPRPTSPSSAISATSRSRARSTAACWRRPSATSSRMPPRRSTDWNRRTVRTA